MAVVAVLFSLWLMGALSTLLVENMFGWVMSNFVLCGVVAACFMSAVFLLAERIRRYDLVDAAWGMTFITIALVSFGLQPGDLFDFDLQMLVTVLVVIWGGRLTFHILERIKRTDSEDPRYVELRKKWKGNMRLNIYVRVYLVQALLALFICVPVLHINLFADNGMTAQVWVGVFVWVIGFLFEVVGDQQLRNFAKDPNNKGKVMTHGLWRYSRHPNYFGELTQWWGIFIICLTTPFGWVGVIGPVLISYLVLFVSGIPLNEKRFEGRSEWARYKARTSALLPLPPRKG